MDLDISERGHAYVLAYVPGAVNQITQYFNLNTRIYVYVHVMYVAVTVDVTDCPTYQYYIESRLKQEILDRSISIDNNINSYRLQLAIIAYKNLSSTCMTSYMYVFS